MLVKLYPEQFKAGWKAFAPMLKRSLPAEIAMQEKALTNLLQAVLAERATPWVELKDGTSQAFMLTVVDEEPLLHYRRLLIYVLNVFGKVDSRDTWHEGIETLKKHAKAQGCKEVVMYVSDERFERHLASLGVDVSTTFMQIPVN